MIKRKANLETKQNEAEGRQREIESSFESVARKWWEVWYAGRSSRHAEKIMRCLEVDIFPAYGHKFIDEVIPPEIWQVMMTAERRETRGIAKRIHETTNQICRFAMINGMASDNPAAHFSSLNTSRRYCWRLKTWTTRL